MGISLTVTDLDAFLRYREQEEMTLGELLAKLRRETEPTMKMLAGRALHSVLEQWSGEELRFAEHDGYTFRFDADIACSVTRFRELSGRRTYTLGDGREVTLRGRTDGFDGITVVDHKLTKKFDAERYQGRYQWRGYLSIFGAERFVYNVFEGESEDDGGAHWKIRGFHTLRLYRYPELDADVERALGEYAEFADEYLREVA